MAAWTPSGLAMLAARSAKRCGRISRTDPGLSFAESRTLSGRPGSCSKPGAVLNPAADAATVCWAGVFKLVRACSSAVRSPGDAPGCCSSAGA